MKLQDGGVPAGRSPAPVFEVGHLEFAAVPVPVVAAGEPDDEVGLLGHVLGCDVGEHVRTVPGVATRSGLR